MQQPLVLPERRGGSLDRGRDDWLLGNEGNSYLIDYRKQRVGVCLRVASD